MNTTLRHSVIAKYKNPYFIETGTGTGECVRLALSMGFKKVISIEIDPIRQEENKKKFAKYIADGRVTLITGDSITELDKLMSSIDSPATFWLDAHVDEGPCGIKKCPLYEELDSIAKNPIKQHTILIDDMRILGTHWGSNISQAELILKLKQINENYKISYEDGCAPNDILVATLN